MCEHWSTLEIRENSSFYIGWTGVLQYGALLSRRKLSWHLLTNVVILNKTGNKKKLVFQKKWIELDENARQKCVNKLHIFRFQI